MNARLLGLFSGFPTHHFPDAITQVLRENLPRRESLVFVSAWPEDFARNDGDNTAVAQNSDLVGDINDDYELTLRDINGIMKSIKDSANS